MRHFNSCGIDFMYEFEDGWKPIHHQLNPTTADFAEKTCETMAKLGVTKVYTAGIRNNRQMRGSTKTSTHSDGLKPQFQVWPDGTNGCRAMDIISVEFRPDGPIDGLDVSIPGDRKAMIAFCEMMGWTVLHKKPLKHGDHIHIQTELKQ